MQCGSQGGSRGDASCRRRLRAQSRCLSLVGLFELLNTKRIGHLTDYAYEFDFTQGLTTTAIIERFFANLKQVVGRKQRIGDVMPRTLYYVADRSKRVEENRQTESRETIAAKTAHITSLLLCRPQLVSVRRCARQHVVGNLLLLFLALVDRDAISHYTEQAAVVAIDGSDGALSCTCPH